MNKWGLVGLFSAFVVAATYVTEKYLGFWDFGRYPYTMSASTIAPDVDILYRAISYITTGMFYVVWGLLIAFCVMYRRRPGVKPHYTHGNKLAEAIWTAIPAAMLVGIAIWQMPAWATAKQQYPKPGDADFKNVVVLEAFAQQYGWNFRYRPGDNTTDFAAALDTESDGNSASPLGEDIGPKQMFVPVNTKALIKMTSTDVIHSLFIPHMRVKQDAVPGMYVHVWFEPNRFQVFELATGKWDWVISDEDFDKKYGNAKVAFREQLFAKYDEASREVKVEFAKLPTGEYIKTTDYVHQGKVYWDKSTGAVTHAIGVFEIACAELCGQGHFSMKSSLRVGTKLMYHAWLTRQAEYQVPPIWKRWVDRAPIW